MIASRGRISEKPQRDPAGHEVKFGTVIWIGRRRGLAYNSIRGIRLAGIDELPGQNTNSAPPFIGILIPQLVARNRKQQLGRSGDVVAVQLPVKSAQGVAQVAACCAWNRIKQQFGLFGLLFGGRASLDDCDAVVAEVLGGARRGAEILGADAPVHTSGIIGAG